MATPKAPPQVDHEAIVRGMRQIGDTLAEFSRAMRAQGVFGAGFKGDWSAVGRILRELPPDELRRLGGAAGRLVDQVNTERARRDVGGANQ